MYENQYSDSGKIDYALGRFIHFFQSCIDLMTK
jgi:hypothetical protein